MIPIVPLAYISISTAGRGLALCHIAGLSVDLPLNLPEDSYWCVGWSLQLLLSLRPYPFRPILLGHLELNNPKLETRGWFVNTLLDKQVPDSAGVSIPDTF